MLRGGAHEIQRVGQDAGEFVGCEAETGIRPKTLEQIVALGALFAQAQSGGHRVFLDRFVGLLASDAVTDRSDKDLGRGQERQVPIEFALDHGRVGTEVVENGEEGLKESVDGEERVGQGHPTNDRATHVAFVPLVTGERRNHREMTAQDGKETADAFAAATVHLVRHGRRTDLPGTETLGCEFLTSHESDRDGEIGGAGGGLNQRGDHVEIERTRVHLTDVGEGRIETEMGRDPRFELVEAIGVAIEEVEHVLLGPDRALDPAQRIALEKVVDPVEGLKEFLAGIGETLAERRGLGRHVVTATGHDEFRRLGGALGKTGERCKHPTPDENQRTANLKLFDVLGEIARGHSLVDVLVAGQGAELVDPGLHVVAGDPFALVDRIEIDLLHDGAVIGDGHRRYRDAEIALCFEHRQPQLAFEDDLVLGRPETGHVGTRITSSQNVGNDRRVHEFSYAPARCLRSAASASARAVSEIASISTTSNAALTEPSIATVATGMPRGI